ncbi:MAG TPA: hypothetical protein DEF51_35105 [Myxococcales bacterium]|nr:hypothetical protein [Myxococcales bacterium]
MSAAAVGEALAKTPQTYRFALTDGEYRRAWIREYYRRPGARMLRLLAGPLIALLGVGMLARAPRLFERGMGVVALFFGLYLLFKPLLLANALVRRRQRTGMAERELEVTLRAEGIRIDDGKIRTNLPWDEVRAAGRGPDYVWYEMKGGSRATIPLRAVDDLEALEALLRDKTSWNS